MARTGVGNAGRAGGAGVTCGAGGSMNCASTSAGTISSAARSTKPLCSAQISTTCNATTLAAIAVLRLRRGKGKTGIRRGEFDGEMACMKSGSPKKGSVWRVCAGRDNQKRDIAKAAGVCPLKIHQAQPITRAMLTGRVMIKMPGCSMMQLAPDGCLTKCRLLGSWHCTGPLRRGRSLHSSRTG